MTKKTVIVGVSKNINDTMEKRAKQNSFLYRVSGMFGKLLCKIGWHEWTCTIQDCLDEFGYVPNDNRMPKVSKCSRCGKNYR